MSPSSSPDPRDAAGGESHYSLGIPGDLASYVAKLLAAQTERGDFVQNVLTARRKSLKCTYHLLASRMSEATALQFKIVHTNDSPDGGRIRGEWQPLFENALKRKDGAWTRNFVAGEQVNLVAVAVQAKLLAPHRKEPRLIALMLVVYHRIALPDERYSVAFRTYDETFARATLLDIAHYIRHEYWDRTSAVHVTRNLTKPEVRGMAAWRLLDFEDRLGLPFDVEVVESWLEAEKERFVEGLKPSVKFEQSLGWLTTRLERIPAPDPATRLRDLLFDCQLARLTVEHSLPLLSQRIAEARNLAGLEGGAAK